MLEVGIELEWPLERLTCWYSVGPGGRTNRDWMGNNAVSALYTYTELELRKHGDPFSRAYFLYFV